MSRIRTSSRSSCCLSKKGSIGVNTLFGAALEVINLPHKCTACTGREQKNSMQREERNSWVVISRGIENTSQHMILVTSTRCVMTHVFGSERSGALGTPQSVAVSPKRDNAHILMYQRKWICIPSIRRTEEACKQLSKFMTHLLRR